jgi:uncharacterized protein YbjT (DUF2867 family)
MILITGASGGVGSQVLAETIRTGKPVRAMYRSKDEAAKASPKVPTVMADFADAKSLDRALAGVDTVFLVCSPVRQLVELEGNMIDACRRSGVKFIVLNSALGAGDYPKSFPSWHRKVEDKLQAFGGKDAILRPNTFMQNILAYFAPSIRAQGAFSQSVGNAKISFIDVRDIARVAAKILTSPESHAGKIYELNGPQALSYSEVAEAITRITGVSAKYVDIPFEQQRKSLLDSGMPEWQVSALLDLQRYYTGGKGGDLDGTLANLLGRPATTLDQFLKEFAEQFRSESARA